MADQPVDAYPLTWPANRPRSKYRDNSRFSVTPARAYQDVREEVERLDGSGLIISSNVPLRRDGKTIEALRGIERWGSGNMVEQAFTGFTALPAPESWWQVLGLSGPQATRAEIEEAHRRLIMQHHPDRGGDTERAARINRARDQGLEAV